MNVYVSATRLWLLTILAAMAGCDASRTATPDSAGQPSGNREAVTVFAAASTTNAMDEVKEAFARTSGIAVQTNYAASSTLAQQIANGAAPDVFLSANVGWADYVESEAAVRQRRDLLGNRLVIIVAADSQLDLERPEDLLSENVKYLALGDPQAVPAGKYAKQALVALGIWEKLKGKVAAAKDVRHALTYVETGAAEAGIVYATDAAVSGRVRVAVEIPTDLTEPVLYPAVLLNDSKPARAFYDYLRSPEADRIFEKHGFVVVQETGADATQGRETGTSPSEP